MNIPQKYIVHRTQQLDAFGRINYVFFCEEYVLIFYFNIYINLKERNPFASLVEIIDKK